MEWLEFVLSRNNNGRGGAYCFMCLSSGETSRAELSVLINLKYLISIEYSKPIVITAPLTKEADDVDWVKNIIIRQ